MAVTLGFSPHVSPMCTAAPAVDATTHATPSEVDQKTIEVASDIALDAGRATLENETSQLQGVTFGAPEADALVNASESSTLAQDATTEALQAVAAEFANAAALTAETINNLVASQAQLIASQGSPATPAQAADIARTAARANAVVDEAAAAIALLDAIAHVDAGQAPAGLAAAAASASAAQAIAAEVTAAASAAQNDAPAPRTDASVFASATPVDAAPLAVDPAPVSVARRIFKVAIFLSGAALVVSVAVMALVLTAFFLQLLSPVALLVSLGLIATAVVISASFLGASVRYNSRFV